MMRGTLLITLMALLTFLTSCQRQASKETTETTEAWVYKVRCNHDTASLSYQENKNMSFNCVRPGAGDEALVCEVTTAGEVTNSGQLYNRDYSGDIYSDCVEG